MNRTYYVYIMTNRYHTVLYTGVTNDISRRAVEHLLQSPGSFTRRYNIVKVVYVEQYGEVVDAICREKQIKGCSRQKKLALISGVNPTWRDLCAIKEGRPPK